MIVTNLAEPDWIMVSCDQPMLGDTVCGVNKLDKHPQNATYAVNWREYCDKGHISSGNYCLYLCWSRYDATVKMLDVPSSAFALNTTYLSQLAKAAGNFLAPIFFPCSWNKIHSFTFNPLKMDFDHTVVAKAPTEGFLLQLSEKNQVHVRSNLFKCSGGYYIDVVLLCDGHADCFSASDEHLCRCNISEKDQSRNCQKFVFGNKHTCSALYIENAKGDCLKFTEASVTVATSQMNFYFLCNQTHRNDVTLSNDLIGDCSNAEDEQELVSLLRFETTAKCRNKNLLPCVDGHSHCFNISLLCTYKLLKFSNLFPCKNGSHLENCVSFQCNTLFKCSKSYCIPWVYLCDMKWDCPSGNDESDICLKMNICEGMFKCKGNTSQFCVHLGTVCDGYEDCLMGDDESLCVISKLACPSGCQCLALAMICVSLTFIGTESYFPYLSVSLVQVSLDVQHLGKFPKIIYFSLIDLGITDICEKLSTKSLASLNIDHNHLSEITQQCFSCQTNLRVLQMSHNQIHSLEKAAFVCLPSQTHTNLSFNSLVSFPIHLLRSARNVKCLSLIGLTFQGIKPQEFKDVCIGEIKTTDYHVCCLNIVQKCNAEKPWYVSCGPLLSQAELPVFVNVSVLLLLLYVSSLVFHCFSEGHRKPYTAFVVAVNSTNSICVIYLCILWVAHFIYKDVFFVNEIVWRPGVMCLVVFNLILCFHILTLSINCLLSLSKLMVVIHPLNSSFKNRRACEEYIVASILPSLTLSFLATLVLKFLKITLPTALCLPLADPSNSIVSIKVMTVFMCVLHTCLSIAILCFYYQTVTKVQKHEAHVATLKSKSADSHISLVVQLLVASFSVVLCWIPANIIYVISTFSSLYPIKLIVWVSIAVVPLNSIVQPVVFMLYHIRQERRAKNAKEAIKGGM